MEMINCFKSCDVFMIKTELTTGLGTWRPLSDFGKHFMECGLMTCFKKF